MTQPSRDSKGRFAKPNKNFLYIVCVLIILGLLCVFHAIGYYDGVKATKEPAYNSGFADGKAWQERCDAWVDNRTPRAPDTTKYYGLMWVPL